MDRSKTEKFIKKKDKHFRNYKKHGYKEDDKAALEPHRTEGRESIEGAKRAYHQRPQKTTGKSSTES